MVQEHNLEICSRGLVDFYCNLVVIGLINIQ